MLFAIAGCTAAGSTDGTDLQTSTTTSELSGTCSTETIYPTDWYPGAPIPFPASVDHLENLQVRWDSTSFYAWGIGDGTTVAYAYHVKFIDQQRFISSVIGAMPTQGVAGQSSKSWGVNGVGGPCCSPHPVPIGPGPIGFPPIYVKRLAQFAGTATDTANFGNQVMGQYEQYATVPTATILTTPQ